MKKRLFILISLIFVLSTLLCGCSGKYDNMINAIEDENYSEAESEFMALVTEIRAEQYASITQGTSSSNTSSNATQNDEKIKTLAITTENFFDYFYIEKKQVPYITDSGDTINLTLPAYITLKEDYTISNRHTTQIAIEYTADYNYRYCVADENFKEVMEVGEPYKYHSEGSKHETMTISVERTSVYANGMAGSFDGSRHINYVFNTFEISRAIGTLYIIEK